MNERFKRAFYCKLERERERKGECGMLNVKFRIENGTTKAICDNQSFLIEQCKKLQSFSFSF